VKGLSYLLALAIFVSSSAFGEAKKKPWVATKDSYKTKDAKNLPKARKPANTDDPPETKAKPKTNIKPKTAKKASKPAAPKEVVQEKELAPPSDEPPAPIVEKAEKAHPPSISTAPVASPPTSTPKLTGVSELRERIDDETRQYTFRIHSYLGVLIAKNSGSVYGINVAIVPDNDSLWYFGPEVNYSNPSAGSMMSVLAGAWRDFPIYGASHLSLGVGALLGPVFAATGTGYASPTYGAFLNTALCKEIDELALLRAEFRPGFVGGRFAFLMNFGVTFRFL